MVRPGKGRIRWEFRAYEFYVYIYDTRIDYDGAAGYVCSLTTAEAYLRLREAIEIAWTTSHALLFSAMNLIPSTQIPVPFYLSF